MRWRSLAVVSLLCTLYSRDAEEQKVVDRAENACMLTQDVRRGAGALPRAGTRLGVRRVGHKGSAVSGVLVDAASYARRVADHSFHEAVCRT